MTTDKKIIITIGRQLGSGGRLIGERLAQELGIAFYDKEVLQLAVKESGINVKFFEESDERGKGFFGALSGFFAPLMGGGSPDDNQLSRESLFKIQSNAIRKVADEASCVIVGRCADYVLRDAPRCISIFISAGTTDRIKRLCQLKNISAHEAQRLIHSGDERRAAYYNYFSTGKWGAAATYDLCVNSSVLGVEGTIAYIKDFVQRKLG